jgi:tRNA A-37 threonylcarbamoyl transferase component Bud32
MANMGNEYLTGNEEIVDGVYPLGALIRRSVAGAIYETEFGEGAIPAVIKIREVQSAQAENLRQRLWNVDRLAHPNLLKIYATGSSMLNGVPVFYVVMERAEESLEAVLTERALTNSETREMLVPALEALGYLHKEGYAHSRLRPSNVLAVNDRLKLSTDSVIQPADGGAAEDMRALGVLILKALNQKIPNAYERRDSQDFDAIPQPLADIVRHCLDPDSATRWTVEQVKASLNAPPVVVEKLSPSEEDPDALGPKPKVAGLTNWIYAGLAALTLTVILAVVVRNNNSAPVANPVATAAQQDGQAPATDPAPVPRAEAPQAPAPQSAARPRAAASTERKVAGWSVIVGAYRSRELAEKRMHEMTKRWPNFAISVFESHEEKAPYLLVLGRNLSEDQAEALRQRAFQSRLPGDTYIKRVM